jgi:hypothetical protein
MEYDVRTQEAIVKVQTAKQSKAKLAAILKVNKNIYT